MTKGTRRDPLDVLLEKQAAIEKRKLDLAKKANPVEEAIALAKQRREDEDNKYLGAVARLVLDDHVVHRRMVDAAAKVIENAKSKTKARAALLRVLGPLPVTQLPSVDTGKPAKPSVVTDFARAGK